MQKHLLFLKFWLFDTHTLTHPPACIYLKDQGTYIFWFFRAGETDRHLLELEDVGEIKCVQFRLDGTDGWNIANVGIQAENRGDF